MGLEKFFFFFNEQISMMKSSPGVKWRLLCKRKKASILLFGSCHKHIPFLTSVQAGVPGGRRQKPEFLSLIREGFWQHCPLEGTGAHPTSHTSGSWEALGCPGSCLNSGPKVSQESYPLSPHSDERTPLPRNESADLPWLSFCLSSIILFSAICLLVPSSLRNYAPSIHCH